MKKMTVFCGFAFAVLMSGCASHSVVKSSYDPATECDERFDQTGNGSTRLEQHCRSKIIGGASHEGHEFNPYSSFAIPHPPMRMIQMGEQSQSERSMGDIPGGPVLLHPGSLDGYAKQREVDEMQGDIDALTVVVTSSDDEEAPPVQKNKKDGNKGKPQPSNGTGGNPSRTP